MFPITKLWVVFTFIVSIAATPFSLDRRAGSVVVGYRSVSKTQADAYKAAGSTLTWDGSQNSQQLGPGVYISPVYADWAGAANDPWYCVILADSDAWNLVNKAWIPGTDGCKELWWGKGADNRAAYLKDIAGPGATPANTVLLSQIDGFQKLQLLIPPELLDANGGGLKIKAQCAAASDTAGSDAIKAFGDVNWAGWLNVKGTVQTV
ncbi:hypothetical protein GP486_005585 [Trichoglossum hirsutum]|uniref:Uncharacterized protein n=1 Tax=Trichoglossum hirsutum TaxID=265104 RepID=A0A9P8L8Y8_9PEZI|nr:hypothetical protein GP486_005585 [Trichoglossum hirsutum]